MDNELDSIALFVHIVWKTTWRHLGGTAAACYHSTMWHALSRFFICIFAIALVLNGGALRALADVPAAHAHHFATMSSEADHATHHHAQPDGATVAPERLPAHDHVADGAKCCSMCMVMANVIPAFVATSTQLYYRAVIFKVGRQHLVGHLVPLDPDIPKTIV